MFKFNKKQFNKKLLGGAFLLALVLTFFAGANNKTLAEEKKEPTGYCGVRCSDRIKSGDYSDGSSYLVKREGITKAECIKFSEETQKSVSGSLYDDCIMKFEANKTEKDLSSLSSFHPANNKTDVACDFFKSPMVCLLSPFLSFVKLIFLGAATFFGWILDVDNIRAVLGGGGVVYKMWVVVRDLLNIAFILVLLFSAFATIFQIEKYNYKKILLTLVIMALLVNFSYPIARTIIDFSNVLMYSLIKTFLSSGSDSLFMTQEILKGSTMEALFNFKSYENSGVGTMMVAVVFLFIFSMTLMTFAIILFIRLMALALLVMFSPIGFVGNIMPGFESFAKKWWDNLFKYAFMGPILMLGLYISIQMMNNISGLGDFKNTANSVTSKVDPSSVASIAFMAVPIVLLWSTMGIAQSMGAAGAAKITGKAQGLIKKAGMKLSGANFAKKTYGTYKKGRESRKEALNKTALSTKFAKKMASKPGEWRDKGQAFLGKQIPAPVPGSKAAQTRMEERRKEDIAELRKEKREKGVSFEELQDMLKNGDSTERTVAALEMAENKGFGKDPKIALANYQAATKTLEGDAISQETFNDKVKKKHIKLVIENEVATKKTPRPTAYRDNLKGMNAKALSNQKGLLSDTEFINNYLMSTASADPKLIQEIAKNLSKEDREAWIRHGFI